MLTLQRFKGAMITVLVALLICAVGAYTVDATTESGYKSNIYWEFSLDNLEAANNWAYSDHYVYIINNRHRRITVDWEFSHKILEHGAVNHDLPDDTVFGTVIIDGLGEPGGDVRFSLSDVRQTYYGHLDFDEHDYYLEAYTRINIHGLSIPTGKIADTLDLSTE